MSKKRITVVIEYEESRPSICAHMSLVGLAYEFEDGEVAGVAFYDALNAEDEE